MEITDAEIETLINCPKRISKPPRKEDETDRGHRKNSMAVQSEDGRHNFTVHFRQNVDFEENYSVILQYHQDRGKELTLMRCNGPHGPHEMYYHHSTPHLHIATAKNIHAGLKEERSIEITSEYTTYAEAKRFFIKRCGIIGGEKYLSASQQLKLFP